MSSATPRNVEGLVRGLGPEHPLGSLAAPLSTLAFWTAITLPVLYLPLFLAGLDTAGDLGLFLGLFGLHVLALLVGHAHDAAV